MILDQISSIGAPHSQPSLGIGRRRGKGAANKKRNLHRIIAIGVSFTITSLIIILYHILSVSSTTTTPTSPAGDAVLLAVEKEEGDALREEETVKQFGKWAGILRADMHLIGIETLGIHKHAIQPLGYQGVKGHFCKLNWNKYKQDPPSYPMFRMLISESGCDKKRNILTLDLTDVVDKAREYDKSIAKRQTPNADDVHVMPPSGFVFHESRVGSTLVANSLTALSPDAHRVFSESDPINEALKACQGVLSTCDVDVNAALLRDVVYLMGRTNNAAEKRMFFKVSSIGSKHIDLMQYTFPEVPWIFVYRDPVQTMMSHLDPKKIKEMEKKGIRGTKAVCLRSRKNPPKDLVSLAEELSDNRNVNGLNDEEFCALHLASLCISALKQMQDENSKGIAVEYDNLVDKLIKKIIPVHFGVSIDNEASQRILDVSKIYSKSKGAAKDWKEDSEAKEIGSTSKIRHASELFLQGSYEELQKHTIV